MSYQPPHRRKQIQKLTSQTTKAQKPNHKCKQQIKLAHNEQLLSDGRILIRGSLRPDGTRRPDRYKKAGFYNDEDRQRNKYIPRPKRKQIQKHSQTHKQTLICVQTVVNDIISNPPKPIHKNHTKLGIDFNNNVVLPLLNEFYGNNPLLLNTDITDHFTQNMDKCRQLINDELLRTEIIKFMHKLLYDRRNLLLPSNVRNTSKPVMKGKGNQAFGTGVMLSDRAEMDRKKNRNQIRKLNQKYKEINKLEQRQIKGDTLNEQQISKIKTKPSVLQKLKELKITP